AAFLARDEVPAARRETAQRHRACGVGARLRRRRRLRPHLLRLLLPRRHRERFDDGAGDRRVGPAAHLDDDRHRLPRHGPARLAAPAPRRPPRPAPPRGRRRRRGGRGPPRPPPGGAPAAPPPGGPGPAGGASPRCASAQYTVAPPNSTPATTAATCFFAVII